MKNKVNKLKGRSGKGKKHSLSDKEHRKDFIKAGFSLLDTFVRSTTKTDSQGGYSYFDWTCHICSDDAYVDAGLCSGVFTSSMGDLKKGKKSCRCSKGYRFKEGQREFQIKTLLDKEGATFIRWKSEDRTSYCKFEWICCEGHHCETSVTSFVNNGSRCDRCIREAGKWGYYRRRLSEEDNLYLLLFKSAQESFIKVGRSFDVKERMREFHKHYNSVTVLATLQGSHKYVYRREQLIHEQLKCLGYHYKPTVVFGGSYMECFTMEALPLAKEIFSNLKTK